MKSIPILCVTLMGGVTFGAGELDNAILIGRTDRHPFAYEVGEEAVFTIRLKQTQPFPDGKYFLRWRTQADGGRTFKGKEPLSYGKPVTVKARIVTNGFVRVLSYVCDREGKHCRRKIRTDGLTPEGKKAMNAGETKSKDIIFNGAAAAHPERMRSVPEPADFDAFWAKRKATLAAVPMKVDLKEHPSSSPKAKCYTFSIACAGPRPVTGSLTVPSKPGKYPAEITFHGYAKSFVQRPPRKGYADRLHMFINAHGYELEREQAYYTAFYESIKSNGHTFGIDPEQNADPDKAYFGGMTYRIMRALEYLKSRPEWDGKNLTAAGGSMGGLQAIWAGALDPDVTKVSAIVPWCCDMGGRVTLRRFYPGRPKETVALRYFDPVNLAKRIPKTTWVDIPRAGLGDISSPPNGIAVLWNNLCCRKSIRWVQGSTHGEEPPKEFREEYVFKEDPRDNFVETVALQSAIDGAFASGGGTVTVPAGRHLVGQIDLRSNVELHLEKGAVLEGAVGLENYRVTTLPYSEGTWSAIVSAIGVTNVAITGEGEIFGNGTAWPQPENYEGNQEGRRPRGVFFADCKNVRLRDFTLRDSACWGVVFKCCEEVDVRRLKIDNHANANNDGIDVEAKNVVIADCDIDAGDDGVCLKSNTPDFIVENVLVTNVTARSHCNALKLGTASHGTMRNVLFIDCRTEAPRRDFIDRRFGRNRRWYEESPERIKKAPGARLGEASGTSAICVENVDGGIVENVTYRNIVANGSRSPIFVRAGTRAGRSCGTPPSDKYVFRNVHIENVTGTALSGLASSISGVPGCRLVGMTLRNVRIKCRGLGETTAERTRPVPEAADRYPDAHMFGCMLPAYGLYVRHVDGFRMENVVFELETGTSDKRDPIVFDDVPSAVAPCSVGFDA